MSKTKNKLSDLNNHLFAQLERLSDEDLEGDALEQEIKRAEAVCAVSSQIIENGNLVLRAEKMRQDYGSNGMKSVGLLEEKDDVL